MIDRGEHWTTQELELYHDGELDASRRSPLNEALRRDPKLRARLASIRRLDDMLGNALIDESPPREIRSGVAFYRSAPVVVAASMLLAVVLAGWYLIGRRPARTSTIVNSAYPPQTGRAEKAEYQPIRVVCSLPIRSPRRARPDEPPPTPDASTPSPKTRNAYEDADFLVRLDRSLEAGNIRDALDLLDGASREQRNAAYQRIGELIRSAYTAEQILDRLDSREQLAVCSRWAKEPTLRPIVFARLRRFSNQPELSEELRAVIRELAEDPVLFSWLRGYRLVDHS